MPYNDYSFAGVNRGMLTDAERANIETARQNAQMAIMQEHARRQREAQDQASSDSRYATDAMLASNGTFADRSALAANNFKNEMAMENARTQRAFGMQDRSMGPANIQAQLDQRRYDDQGAARQKLMEFLKGSPAKFNTTPGTPDAQFAGPPAPGAQPNWVDNDDPNREIMLAVLGAQAGLQMPDFSMRELNKRKAQAEIARLDQESEEIAARRKAAGLTDPYEANKALSAVGLAQAQSRPIDDALVNFQEFARATSESEKASSPKNFTGLFSTGLQDPDAVTMPTAESTRGLIPNEAIDKARLQERTQKAELEKAIRINKLMDKYMAIRKRIAEAKVAGVNPRDVINAETLALRKQIGDQTLVLPAWVTQ